MPGIPYYGGTATLQGQFETAYRTPPVSPNTQLLKFEKLTIGQDADLAEDDTINAAALPEKRDEMDSSASGTGTLRLCLNEIGWWLKLLWGAPVTTGAGPYVHTFTLNLLERPSALLELQVSNGSVSRYHRFLGMKLKELGFDVMEKKPDYTVNLMGAVEVKPFPTAAFDLTPSALYDKLVPCTKRANIYDVLNNSTLGDITKCPIKFDNDFEGYPLADGGEGMGCILLGRPTITGSMAALFTPGTAFDYALAHTSKKLVMETKDASGTYSMVITLPNIEFDRPKAQIETSKGLVVDGLAWRAHNAAGAAAPTIVLTNQVASYP